MRIADSAQPVPVVPRALASALGLGSDSSRADITGAGSTFVAPMVSKWSTDYAVRTGTHVKYQSIGSGGGITEIKTGTVDFGAPMRR